MAYTILESPEPSDTEDFRSLRGKQGHLERGVFIAEGPKIVRMMLDSRLEIETAFMTRNFFQQFEPLLASRPGQTKVILAEKLAMEEVVGYDLHQGVMVSVRIPVWPELSEALASWRRPFTVVALDSISDAENMGAIIRNCAAFGVDALLIDDQCCNPYLRRSVRVSMGTITELSIVRVPKLLNALETLRQDPGVSVIAAALNPVSVSLATLKRQGSLVLVFGSEGWGLRPEILKACDTIAMIPMAHEIDSLNVAVANGIFLHHFAS
jgi:tRNA G18 (ribose-2'-O)-methylase SpoU